MCLFLTIPRKIMVTKQHRVKINSNKPNFKIYAAAGYATNCTATRYAGWWIKTFTLFENSFSIVKELINKRPNGQCKARNPDIGVG